MVKKTRTKTSQQSSSLMFNSTNKSVFNSTSTSLINNKKSANNFTFHPLQNSRDVQKIIEGCYSRLDSSHYVSLPIHQKKNNTIGSPQKKSRFQSPKKRRLHTSSNRMDESQCSPLTMRHTSDHRRFDSRFKAISPERQLYQQASAAPMSANPLSVTIGQFAPSTGSHKEIFDSIHDITKRSYELLQVQPMALGSV